MTHSRFSPGSRDNNERSFTELLRKAGIRYNLAPEGHGCDIYVFLPHQIQLWEIKNPDVPPSKRRLTECEENTKTLCDALGIPYHVLEEVDEAVRILNPMI